MKIDYSWATSTGIYNALINIFGDRVHIIDPELSSIHTPYNNKDITGVVNYIMNIESLIT